MKLYRVPVLCGISALVAFSLLFLTLTYAPNSGEAVRGTSVEIGLAEISPRGDEGGYAVPASGGTTESLTSSTYSETVPPACQLYVTPNSVSQGQGSDMYWTWAASSGYPQSITVYRTNAGAINWAPILTVNGSNFAYDDSTVDQQFAAHPSVRELFIPTAYAGGGGSNSTPAEVVQLNNGTSKRFDTGSSSLTAGTYYYRAEIKWWYGPGAPLETRPCGGANQIVQSSLLPDLVSAVRNYGTYLANTASAFTFGLSNQGQTPTTGGFRNKLEFDFGANGYTEGSNGDFAAYADSAVLASGASVEVTATGVSFGQAGTWQVCAVADSSNTETELNEGNNRSNCDQFTVSAGPQAEFKVREVGTSVWSSASTFEILAGKDIELSWQGSNADRCDGGSNPSGGGFSTGGSVGPSVDSDITEPLALQSTTYVLRCSGGTGTTPSDRQITVSAYPTTPSLTATDTSVRAGSETTLKWDTYFNDPAQCTLAGPGITSGPVGSRQGERTVTIGGASTYTLTCPGGTATLTIQVLPQLYES